MLSAIKQGRDAELAAEVDRWEDWLAAGPKGITGDDYRWRLNPKSTLASQPHIIRWVKPFAPPGTTVSILDVGAGAMTVVGKVWPGRRVRITAVDPLARPCNALLDRWGVVPPVRTQVAEPERLSEMFPPAYFDLVYCHQAFDRVDDPVRAIEEMLFVVKGGRSVVLASRVNEAQLENYFGGRRWNLCRDGHELVIWGQQGALRVNTVLGGRAALHFELDDVTGLLVVALTKGI
jgi:SAM-dependent methyltransferase